MLSQILPLGASAAHPDWPEARFNLSGLFAHDPLFPQLIDLADRDLSCRLPIDSIHGSPPICWNAGRASKVPCDLAAFQSLLGYLNARGIGVFFTFTNHLLERQDLADPVGNRLLGLIAQRPDLNGVIIVSDLLSSHIAERYPALRQIASVIKTTLEGGRGKAEYYRELGRRFCRYVVDPDDMRDRDLLDQLDREKAEILVNENCVADCPNRVRHYEAYARLSKASTPAEKQAANEAMRGVVAGCRSLLNLSSAGRHERSCSLSRPEMKAIYDMGFRHYKLQGRADDPFTYLYDVTRFLLEPDFAAPRIFKFLAPWICTQIVPVPAGS